MTQALDQEALATSRSDPFPGASESGAGEGQRALYQRTLGPDVRLITSGAAAALQVERELVERELAAPRAGEGDYRFLCTGDVDAFKTLGTRFLQMPLGDVRHVELAAEVAA